MTVIISISPMLVCDIGLATNMGYGHTIMAFLRSGHWTFAIRRTQCECACLNCYQFLLLPLVYLSTPQLFSTYCSPLSFSLPLSLSYFSSPSQWLLQSIYPEIILSSYDHHSTTIDIEHIRYSFARTNFQLFNKWHSIALWKVSEIETIWPFAHAENDII